MKVREELLHFIWKMISKRVHGFKSASGDKIIIRETGVHNHYAGPDFLEANVLIGETPWFGSVELHCKSSDWYHHKHEKDPNYDNVLLHVVYLHDKEVYRRDGSTIPVIELRHILPQEHLRKYEILMQASLNVPCEKLVLDIDKRIKSEQLKQACAERLGEKSEKFLHELEKVNGDWNQHFIQKLFTHFGFKTNAKAMRALLDYIPFHVLQKSQDSLQSMNALLMGSAGFLEKPVDDYSSELAKEFQFLKHKHLLSSPPPIQWRFARTRPHNSPYLRLSQLANLMHSSPHLFSTILQNIATSEMIQLFHCQGESYWSTHTQFGQKRVKPIQTALGMNSAQGMVVNTVVQTLYSYGLYLKENIYCQRALNLLEAIPAEKNRYTRRYQKLGFPLQTALDSQGAIQQYRAFCQEKKCEQCFIGKQIFN